MKTWYKAVCDEHKEMCNVFVNNPSMTSCYLSDKDQSIQNWLMSHYGCKLRLIHLDTDLDEVIDDYLDFSWEV